MDCAFLRLNNEMWLNEPSFFGCYNSITILSYIYCGDENSRGVDYYKSVVILNPIINELNGIQ